MMSMLSGGGVEAIVVLWRACYLCLLCRCVCCGVRVSCVVVFVLLERASVRPGDGARMS